MHSDLAVPGFVTAPFRGILLGALCLGVLNVYRAFYDTSLFINALPWQLLALTLTAAALLYIYVTWFRTKPSTLLNPNGTRMAVPAHARWERLLAVALLPATLFPFIQRWYTLGNPLSSVQLVRIGVGYTGHNPSHALEVSPQDAQLADQLNVTLQNINYSEHQIRVQLANPAFPVYDGLFAQLLSGAADIGFMSTCNYLYYADGKTPWLKADAITVLALKRIPLKTSDSQSAPYEGLTCGCSARAQPANRRRGNTLRNHYHAVIVGRRDDRLGRIPFSRVFVSNNHQSSSSYRIPVLWGRITAAETSETMFDVRDEQPKEEALLT